MPRALKIWLSVGAVLLVSGLGWGVCRALEPARSFRASGPSMEPNLVDGERFVAVPPSERGVKPGDIVVAPAPDGSELVRRVIALGGSTVRARADCSLELDGQPLARDAVACPQGRPAASSGTAGCFEERHPAGASYVVRVGGPCTPAPALRVPEGHVFLVGDHRDRSVDSRMPMIGTVPLRDVAGVVQVEN